MSRRHIIPPKCHISLSNQWNIKNKHIINLGEKSHGGGGFQSFSTLLFGARP